MRLLDRYQLRELLMAFAYCLAGILVFWMSFELLGEIDEMKRRDLGFGDSARYLGHRLPLYLLLQVPVALLLSLLYALSQHARHHELVAMRAAGIGLWRLSMPYLGVGVVLSLGMFLLNEKVVPDAAARAEAVLSKGRNASAGAESDWRMNLNFSDTRSGRDWHVSAFNVVTAELKDVHVRWTGADGGREDLLAAQGRWEDNGWVFERVTRLSFPPGPGTVASTIQTNRLVVEDFPETPAHLRSEVKISRLLGSLKKSRQVQLSLEEILIYRELHRELAPQFDRLLRTWFHDRLATPWTCVVVVLIGIPAAAAGGRRNLFVGVAGAIFLTFAFFVIKEFSLAVGTGGYLPAWVAAWLPNAVFGGLGALLIHRQR
ncbi:MAG: LptF/LptG family permease [Verrucomicrobiales bacterium]|nr:LptF/LptG family permease [Verrucomicrobiales bacterium]